MNTPPSTLHIGRKIERIRKMKGMKQDTLAKILKISHQSVSRMEQSEHIDEARLIQVAEALGIQVDDIKNFDENAMFNNFVHDNGTVFNHVGNLHQNNTIDKVAELYEALLKSEREKIDLLLKQIEFSTSFLALKSHKAGLNQPSFSTGNDSLSCIFK